MDIEIFGIHHQRSTLNTGTNKKVEHRCYMFKLESQSLPLLPGKNQFASWNIFFFQSL